jgi:hypothetical protein
MLDLLIVPDVERMVWLSRTFLQSSFQFVVCSYRLSCCCKPSCAKHNENATNDSGNRVKYWVFSYVCCICFSQCMDSVLYRYWCRPIVSSSHRSALPSLSCCTDAFPHRAWFFLWHSIHIWLMHILHTHDIILWQWTQNWMNSCDFRNI